MKNIKFIIILIIISIAGCGGSANSDLDVDVGVIDYRSAFIYESDSSVNKLLISVNSRVTIEDFARGKRSYILLKDHPRESTFEITESPYLEFISYASGASFITFIYGIEQDSVVVSRRYSVLNKVNEQHIHECRPGLIFDKFYKNLSSSQVFDIGGSKIYSTPRDGLAYFGIFEYNIGKANVKIDFPIALINFNPSNSSYIAENNLLFQVVSGQVPIYIKEGAGDCGSLIPGYLAFRSFDKAQVVYLCKYFSEGVWYYDYGCVMDIPGKLKIFGLPK